MRTAAMLCVAWLIQALPRHHTLPPRLPRTHCAALFCPEPATPYHLSIRPLLFLDEPKWSLEDEHHTSRKLEDLAEDVAREYSGKPMVWVYVFALIFNLPLAILIVRRICHKLVKAVTAIFTKREPPAPLHHDANLIMATQQRLLAGRSRQDIRKNQQLQPPHQPATPAARATARKKKKTPPPDISVSRPNATAPQQEISAPPPPARRSTSWSATSKNEEIAGWSRRRP